MWTSTLTEAEFHVFVERFDSFTAQLTPQERNFVTTILLRACTSHAPEVLARGLHRDSAIHAHLAYALWELTRLAEGSIQVNSLPLPPT
jgi:hypothetical protein